MRKFIGHFFSFLFFANICVAQSFNCSYKYLSPLPGSSDNSIYSTIIIKEGSEINPASLDNEIINVKGSKSGKISGKLLLSDDNVTVIFKPEIPFNYEEIIDVSISEGIKTIDGKILGPFSFSFSSEQIQSKIILNSSLQNSEVSFQGKVVHAVSNLPKITTKIYNESAIGDGKLFLSAYGVINQNFKTNPLINSSILIVNNDGTIHFSKDIGTNLGAGLTDFKMHSNGLMSYPKVLKNYQWTGGAEVIHYIMDKSFSVVDSFQMGNGYVAETHDFQLLPNGHALLMAYYLIPVDLSKAVPGSHPNPYIDGAVIQELDSKKNVVFQWRTWDYINPNIIPWNLVPGNTQQIINVFHLNSIRLDNDGNLLLGTPGMGLKVSRQTGNVLWIIGGVLNQFTFTNVAQAEALGDLGGHTFQRIDNGNILVMDNSPFPWQQGYGLISSEVAEYKIDEVKKSAELIWKYKPDKIISGWHAGSAQRLPNGNTLICWGGPPVDNSVQLPLVTEVTKTGEKVFELFYEGSELESYRAFRFNLDDGKPSVEVVKDLVLEQNTYDFKKDEKNDTGISLKINSLSSLGYNMLIVKKYNLSSVNPEFIQKAPITIPGRIVLSSYGIANFEGEIRFDIKQWGIQDPNNTVIYFRQTENKGMFSPLETTYNFVTGKLTANIKETGEFILAKPDLASIISSPIPYFPANNANVNFKIPLELKWSPVGYAEKYSFQVSLDESFANLLVDNKLTAYASFKLGLLSNNTKYFWRVKAHNDAGESKWSDVQSFTTISPFISVKKPNGGEKFNIGMDYYIQWESNITEPVTVSLIKNDLLIKNLTTTSNSFYLWSVDLKLILADDYKIKIKSVADSSLIAISQKQFSIVNTSSTAGGNENLPKEFSLFQNYPNPFNPETIITYHISEFGFVTMKMFDLLGKEIATLVDEFKQPGIYSYHLSINNMPAGSQYYQLPTGIYFYTLTSSRGTITKKMILAK